MRVILYTGKGGVGKTTLAAATALRLADSGRRVLALSTDGAHSLGDALDLKLGPTPMEVTANLAAVEIDPIVENAERWGQIQAWLRRMLKGTDSVSADELLLMPGLRELFALVGVLEYIKAERHDVLVVDCAPTGETLSLLRYPERFAGFITRLLPMKREMARRFGPTVERLTEIPMPEVAVFDQLAELTGALVDLQAILSDVETTSVRIVTNPERVPVAEARRNYTWLHLYGYHVDAVLVNRLLPAKALQGYFSAYGQLQAASLQQVREGFAGIPVFTLELQPTELVGLPGLRRISAELYGEVDPAAVLVHDRPYQIEAVGSGYRLLIGLPDATRDDLTLDQQGTDLVLAFRCQRRSYALPDALIGREITGARLADGVLAVEFAMQD